MRETRRQIERLIKRIKYNLFSICVSASRNSCRNILAERHPGAVMEIDFRPARSNDRMLGREVHFRPDRSNLWTGRREEEIVERWNISSAILRSAGRYSWIIWCRKNALFSTSSRAREDLWLRRELASIEYTAALLKWRRVFATSLYQAAKITERSESRLSLQNKIKNRASILFFTILHQF